MGSIFQINKISHAIDMANMRGEAGAIGKSRYQDMYDALDSSEDGSDSMISLSAGSENLLKSLQPVSLDPEAYEEYERFFYNRRRAFLIDLFDQVADVSNSFNCLFAFLRDILRSGRMLDMSNEEERIAMVNKYFDRALQFREASRAGSKSPVATSMYSLLGAMMKGDKHTVRASEVYNGGIDVVLARGKQDRELMCSGISYGNSIETRFSSMYENDWAQAYATELSLKALDAAREVQDTFFGAGAYHAAHTALTATLPLSTDFTEAQRIVEKHLGITLGGDLFTNITFGMNSKFNAEQFTRATFVLHAEAAAAGRMEARLHEQAAGGRDNELQNAMVNVQHHIQKETTPEGAVLGRTVGGTVTFTFDGPTSRYICQAEEGEDVNLSTFNNWFFIWSSQFLRKKGSTIKNSLTGGRIKLSNIPRYVLPVSKMGKVTEARRASNMSVEETRGNEDGLYVQPDGTLSYLPPAKERDNLNISAAYEALAAELSKLCSNYSLNSSQLSQRYSHVVASGISFDDYTRGREIIEQMREYEGSMLSYDWDYGLRVYATGHPGIIRCEVQNGAVRPDTLTVADYLGYNMAKEGEAPLQKSFSDAFALMQMASIDEIDTAASFGSVSNPAAFLQNHGFSALLDLYFFYAYQGDFPRLQELVNTAMKDLGIEKLDAETPRDQLQTYRGLIEPDGTVLLAGKNQKQDKETFLAMMASTLGSVSGARSTYIAREVSAGMGAGSSITDIDRAIEEHEDFFVANRSPANHFVRLYNFIAGHVFKQICDRINAMPADQLLSTETSVTVKEKITVVADITRDVETTYTRPKSGTVINLVKPIALMLGKYAPNYEQLEQEAEESVASIERDPSIDQDDIHFAGSQEGFSVFPHQLDAHRYMRKEKPPAFAVFDIRPGGGKTSLGLGDMASLVNDMMATGKSVRPIVLCPDGLIRNWCDDMKSFAGANWNMIPIDNNVFKRWGPERLQAIIEDAPPNTIVVAGLNFLRNNKMAVVLGNAVITVGTNLEFIKAFKFNYVIIDESHKLKGVRTAKHQITKQLTTSSFVEYLRIATGTLIADRVRDIEGQTALYSPHIFRQGELSTSTVGEALEDSLKLGDDRVQLWKVNTPQRARQRLSRYAAVITKTKKEWAFMLPNPIETFHAINFVSSEDSPEDQRAGDLHRQLYDLVVAESVEELTELLKKAKKPRAGDDDDDDDDDDNDDESVSTDMEMDENDELSVLSTADIEAYLQRIERLIIAPEKDPLYEQVFGAYGIKKYTSRKARKIAQIIQNHFKPEIWNKGTRYKEHVLVSHEGKLYLSRKIDLDSHIERELPSETVGVPPSEMPDVWKPEPEGKVIVFCRYTNSVGAVYDALPDNLKKKAVRFTGQEDDKWSNLDAFKSDPKIQILIANEMGMSEGHNLQMASRMVRVESPWGPGELDQSASRIFRPDPKGASEGNIYREAVFLDWVLADETMEVAKQGRLIAKIFNKARFDEAENPNYEGVLAAHLLEEISMSLATLQERPSLGDPQYMEYVEAYAALQAVQRKEFHEMRTTMPATMIPVEPTPPVKGSRVIKTPFVASQDIPDPNNWHLRPLKQVLRTEEGAPYMADPNLLVGKPVLTDLGEGMIVSVNIRYETNKRDGVVHKTRPISSVTVKLRGSDELESFSDTGLVYMPTNISVKDVERHFAVDLAYRKSDIAKQERERRALEKLEEKERQKEERRKKREAKQARVRVASIEAGEKRKRNRDEGKPINLGVRPRTGAIPTTVEPVGEEVQALSLSPAYFHGYLTLESDDLGFAKALKKFKFKEIGEYAFLTVTRRNQANAVMDYIEDNFHLSDQTVNRLTEVFKAFEKGKRGLYNMELAAQNTLPHFFNVSKRMVKDRKEARFYPFFMHDQLMIAVDVATSPVIKRHIGKAIPGAAASWKLSAGALVCFVQNKTALKAKVRELKAAGFTIADEDRLKKEIAQINYRPSRNK